MVKKKLYLRSTNKTICDYIYLNDKYFQLENDYLNSDIAIIDVTNGEKELIRIIGELNTLNKRLFIFNEKNNQDSLFFLSEEFNLEYYIWEQDLIDSLIYNENKEFIYFNFKNIPYLESNQEQVFFIEDCDTFVYNENDERLYTNYLIGKAIALNKKIINYDFK